MDPYDGNDPFADLHKVDPAFRKIWDAAQRIFDKEPIPELVKQARTFLIFDGPMTPPSFNPYCAAALRRYGGC